nr:cytochrome P450 [Dyella sp. ASV21]
MDNSARHLPTTPSTSPTASPPGPPRRWWGLPQIRRMRADYIGYLIALQRQHGDLTRMHLLNWETWDLMSPRLAREALVTHADKLLRWEHGIDVFRQIFGESVLVSEGDTWQRQRRMLMPAFTPKRVAGYATLMVEAAGVALDNAVPSGQAQGEVCMDDLWTDATMDVILRTLFSASAQRDARDAAAATQVISATAFREMFVPFTLPDWLPLSGKAAKRRALRTLRRLIQRHIDARTRGEAGTTERQDLLHMLLALRDEETGESLSSQEIFDQCMVTFQAGHETSATALLWWSLLLATHPQAARRAQAEVDDVLGSATPGAPDMERLPWLVATLKEALRLYPPVSALMNRRVVSPFTLDGHVVPSGAVLRISPWVLHHDERWFPQATQFQPERFLEDAPSPPKGAWMPFGTGPRVCIGQHFAMLEMTLLAAMLLQRYTLDLPDASPAAYQPRMHVTLRPQQPVRLVLRRRA